MCSIIFHLNYELNGILIDYVERHKDLGVMVDSKSKLGILKRTCHFTTDARQK